MPGGVVHFYRIGARYIVTKEKKTLVEVDFFLSLKSDDINGLFIGSNMTPLEANDRSKWDWTRALIRY